MYTTRFTINIASDKFKVLTRDNMCPSQPARSTQDNMCPSQPARSTQDNMCLSQPARSTRDNICPSQPARSTSLHVSVTTSSFISLFKLTSQAAYTTVGSLRGQYSSYVQDCLDLLLKCVALIE